MRATLDALGATSAPSTSPTRSRASRARRRGAAGPERDIDFLAVPADEVRDTSRASASSDGVEFVPGFFEETLPASPAAAGRSCASTATPTRPTRLALDALYPRARRRRLPDRRRLRRWPRTAGARSTTSAREHGITEPIEKVDWTASAGGARATPPIAARAAARRRPRAAPARSPRAASAARARPAASSSSTRARAAARARSGRAARRAPVAAAPARDGARDDRLRHRDHRPGRSTQRCAEPGIRRAAEPDSVVLATPPPARSSATTTLLLDQAAAHEDLEALVLVHQDAEIVEPGLLRARSARRCADPDGRASSAASARSACAASPGGRAR